MYRYLGCVWECFRVVEKPNMCVIGWADLMDSKIKNKNTSYELNEVHFIEV